VFFGPSSCVSEMKYGILRYNKMGLDISNIPEDGQCRPKHVVTNHV
jgi:hypothetical protein